MPTDGPRLDFRELSFPALTRARRVLVRDVAALCRTDPAVARRVLKLGTTQDAILDHNRRLTRAATLQVAELYTGAVYDALAYATLPAHARRHADRDIVVFSGLWGAVRLIDRLPHYKLPIGTAIGTPLAALWRRHLAAPLAEAAGDGLVVDLRSAPYAAAWQPSGMLATRTVRVTVLAERLVAGRRVCQPVSHFNKAAKGRFARELVLDPTDDPAGLLVRAGRAGLNGELTEGDGCQRLSLIEPLEVP